MKCSLKYYFGITVPSFFVLSVLSLPLLSVFMTQEIAENYLVTPFVALGTLRVGTYEVIVLVLALKNKTGITAAHDT